MSHKNRDWSKYNKTLVNRGSLTFWIDSKAIKKWIASKQKGKRGRPFQYSNAAITMAATIRYVFKLSLRACEGLLNSFFKLLKVNCKVPCYTQICKRMQFINLPKHLLSNKCIKHVVLDATGLKVLGEGEWKVKNMELLKDVSGVNYTLQLIKKPNMYFLQI